MGVQVGGVLETKVRRWQYYFKEFSGLCATYFGKKNIEQGFKMQI